MENNIKIEVSFTDEFDQASRMQKSFDSDTLDEHCDGCLGLLLDEFKKFLYIMGHNEKEISRIQLKD